MLISFLYLVIKILVLAGVFFALKWLADWIGVSTPDWLWKILGAIFVILAVIWILLWAGIHI